MSTLEWLAAEDRVRQLEVEVARLKAIINPLRCNAPKPPIF